MIGNVLSPTHLILVLVVVLLVVGPKRLPELSRALGSSVRDFKHGVERGEDEPKEVEKPDER